MKARQGVLFPHFTKECPHAEPMAESHTPMGRNAWTQLKREGDEWRGLASENLTNHIITQELSHHGE